MDLGITGKYCDYEFIVAGKVDESHTTQDHSYMKERYDYLNTFHGSGKVIMVRTHAVMAKGSGEAEPAIELQPI